jgi:DNA-binding transcriptional MerR regulator
LAKSPDAFRTISEVATWLGTQAHVLRFWESKFNAVSPVQRTGGRRYYRQADMTLLGGIKFLLHEQGMTVKGVQKLLKDEGIAHVQSFSLEIDNVETPKPAKAPRPAQVELAQNVVDLQFNTVKVSKTVVLSDHVEQDQQPFLFPELQDEFTRPKAQVTQLAPEAATSVAFGTDLPSSDLQISEFSGQSRGLDALITLPRPQWRLITTQRRDVIAQLLELQKKLSA